MIAIENFVNTVNIIGVVTCINTVLLIYIIKELKK